MPITAREFWARKPVAVRYQTITFAHPAFASTFRLVANEFADVTLGGNVYRPVAMDIKEPARVPNQQPKVVLSFARQQVGREFKAQLRLVRASGSRQPVAVTFADWLQDTDAPKRQFAAYVDDQGGVNSDASVIQVTATLARLRRESRAPRYTIDQFPGLAIP